MSNFWGLNPAFMTPPCNKSLLAGTYTMTKTRTRNLNFKICLHRSSYKWKFKIPFILIVLSFFTILAIFNFKYINLVTEFHRLLIHSPNDVREVIQRFARSSVRPFEAPWLSFALRSRSRILHGVSQWYFISRCVLHSNAASTRLCVILAYIFRMTASGLNLR